MEKCRLRGISNLFTRVLCIVIRFPSKTPPRVTVNITPVTVIIITTPEIVGGAKRDSLPASSSVDSTFSLSTVSGWPASE